MCARGRYDVHMPNRRRDDEPAAPTSDALDYAQLAEGRIECGADDEILVAPIRDPDRIPRLSASVPSPLPKGPAMTVPSTID